jgi:hypothetical protein
LLGSLSFRFEAGLLGAGFFRLAPLAFDALLFEAFGFLPRLLGPLAGGFLLPALGLGLVARDALRFRARGPFGLDPGLLSAFFLEALGLEAGLVRTRPGFFLFARFPALGLGALARLLLLADDPLRIGRLHLLEELQQRRAAGIDAELLAHELPEVDRGFVGGGGRLAAPPGERQRRGEERVHGIREGL